METATLPCRLSNDEVRERGEKVAELHRQRDALEIKRKETVDLIKAQVNEIDGQIVALCTEIIGKAEWRSVEVKREKDFKRNVEELIRVDTGEVVQTRALTPEERQVEMLPLAAVVNAVGKRKKGDE